MKTVCVYHSRDLDGWMSAANVKHWFIINNTNVITVNLDTLTDNDVYDDHPSNIKDNLLYMKGYDYGQPIPDLSKYDSVIMVDIAFPKEEMNKLGKKLIWIDHHASAITDCEKNNEIGISGLRRTDFAACELTWQYFFPNETMPEIVRLLGRYDCFGHKGTNEEQKVLEFQYGARQEISNYEDSYKFLLPNRNNIEVINYIWNKGRSIYQYLCTEAKQTYNKAFPIKLNYLRTGDNGAIEPDYYKFLCVNQERFNPVNFGIDYHKDGYDGFACFWYKDSKWMFSLYNDNGEIDCSVIAKSFGGGGHKGAAGFVIDDINEFLNKHKY